MIDRQNLDNRLNTLQSQVRETQRIYASAVQRTRGELVEAYLWWKDAVQDTEYLEALYEENEIKYENTRNTNQPNFKAVVQLAFEIYDLDDGNNRNKVAKWGKALNAINEQYERKIEFYQHRDNLHNELLNWINDNGGVNGITTTRQTSIEHIGLDDEDEDTNVKTSQPNKQPSQKTVAKKKQQRVATVDVQRQQTQTHTSEKEFEIGEVATDEDELVVILARKNADGTLVHIGDTTDELLVNSALEICTSLSITSKNDILRLLLESLKPHYVPYLFHKRKLRSKFFNKSKVKYEFDDTEGTIRVTESVRLTITSQGDILVSKSPSNSSLITFTQPTWQLDVPYDMFLRSKDRQWLEVEGEHNKVLATCNSVEDDYLEDTASNIKADKQVSILNSATQHKRNIYFYDYDVLDEAFTQPCCFADISKEAVWNTEVSQSWITRFNDMHFRKWIQNTNKRISISENKTFEFVIDKQGIEVQSYWDRNEKEYRNSGDEYVTNWENKIKKRSSEHYHKVNPLDVVQLFEVLSTIQIKGNVELFGFENAEDDGGCFAVRYTTDVATHTAFIPHCNDKGIRVNCDLFDLYEIDYDY